MEYSAREYNNWDSPGLGQQQCASVRLNLRQMYWKLSTRKKRKNVAGVGKFEGPKGIRVNWKTPRSGTVNAAISLLFLSNGT